MSGLFSCLAKPAEICISRSEVGVPDKYAILAAIRSILEIAFWIVISGMMACIG